MSGSAAIERDPADVRARCERVLGQLPSEWHRPKAMLERLAASAGDDDRDAVGRVEARVAELLGKEAAAIMPSGTMAQQIALRIHAERRASRTVLFHPTCHLELDEEKGYERLHGLEARLVGDPNEVVSLSDLEPIREPFAALLLELPQRMIGGRLPAWDELAAQADWVAGRDAALHMDGARLWECGPWYERDYAEIAALFDTVYVSFYKGLGGLAGCALAGPDDVIAEARVWQIRHGGRLPTLAPLALGAELGLDRFLPQMPAFYERAVELGRALAEHPSIDVVPDPPQTPMMHVFLRGGLDRLLEAALDVAEERGVFLFGWLKSTPLPSVQRFELTVGEAALEVPVEEAAALFAEVLERAGR